MSNSMGEWIAFAIAAMCGVAYFYLLFCLRDLLILAAFQTDERDFGNACTKSESGGVGVHRRPCSGEVCGAARQHNSNGVRCTENDKHCANGTAET